VFVGCGMFVGSCVGSLVGWGVFVGRGCAGRGVSVGGGGMGVGISVGRRVGVAGGVAVSVGAGGVMKG